MNQDSEIEPLSPTNIMLQPLAAAESLKKITASQENLHLPQIQDSLSHVSVKLSSKHGESSGRSRPSKLRSRNGSVNMTNEHLKVLISKDSKHASR